MGCGKATGKSHYSCEEGHIATLSVPDHHEVARGILRSLIVRAGLTIEEFLNALK